MQELIAESMKGQTFVTTPKQKSMQEMIAESMKGKTFVNGVPVPASTTARSVSSAPLKK